MRTLWGSWEPRRRSVGSWTPRGVAEVQRRKPPATALEKEGLLGFFADPLHGTNPGSRSISACVEISGTAAGTCRWAWLPEETPWQQSKLPGARRILSALRAWVPFPAKDKHGDQHVPFCSGWQEARGRSGLTTVTSLSLRFRVLSLCHSSGLSVKICLL